MVQWSHQNLSFSLLLCCFLVISSLPRSKAWTMMIRHHTSPGHLQSLSRRRIFWLTPQSGCRRSAARQVAHVLKRDDERAEETSQPSVRDTVRRKTIQSSLRLLLLVTGVFGAGNVAPFVSKAEQQPATTKDPFATFGEQLLEEFESRDAIQQQQRWPYNAASPLPPNNDAQQQEQQQPLTDMERALQKAKEQKRIDPRTHG